MGASGGLIHVGAWIGEEYLATNRRLLLFEPQAEPFARLKASLGHRENVELVNSALGAETGVAVMHTAHPSHSSSLLSPVGPVFEGTETVPLTTLDEAMKGRNGFEELVIDTQGYELEVLRGARETLGQIKRVELEVHDRNTYPGAASLGEITDYLEPLGFVLQSQEPPDAVYARKETHGEKALQESV